MTPANQLYFGDNLAILRERIPSESVDLVYLDPPFNSHAAYNLLFATQDGKRAPAQIGAFDDTWRWDEAAVMSYHEMLSLGGPVADGMRAFHLLLGDSDMMAYLAMMGPRLVELRRVLTSTGSLYLHCDPTASHYLKVLLDAVFGPQQFRSEITWKRTNVHNDAKRWSPVADTLLYYGKTATVCWNKPIVKHSDTHVATKYRQVDEHDRRYTLSDMTSPSPRPNMMYEWHGHASPSMGWRYSRETMERLHNDGRIWYPEDKRKRPRLKRYLDDMPGVVMGTIWDDICPLNSQAAERLGYPTQKPLSLLERIITASSNPGDVVLDPFCGCGTAIDAAQALDRRWIGVDVTHLAINLIKKRLQNRYPDLPLPRVVGEPTTVDGAAELARTDPHGFQDWICALADAQSVRPLKGTTLRLAHKKGADRGIDGRLYFHDDHTGATKQIVLSVKAGHLQPAYVRELRGVMEREGAEMAALLTLHKPTAAMRSEALAAGVYTSPGWNKTYQRVQVVTVADLFAGRGIAYPPSAQTNVTHKKAVRARAVGEPVQPSFFEMPPKPADKPRKRR